MTGPGPGSAGGRKQPLRLHIGGEEPREGWKIVNAQPGPDVDFVGDCQDLSRFVAGSAAEIYASHVYEHLGHQTGLPRALREAHRVLEPGGLLRASVPDLDILCRLFLEPGVPLVNRFYVQAMMYGAQKDEWDYHKVGLNFDIFKQFLEEAGFRNVRRSAEFDLFKDTSTMRINGKPISLNVVAIK